MDKNEYESYLSRIDRAYAEYDGMKIEEQLIGILTQYEERNGSKTAVFASLLSEAGGYYRGCGKLSESECFFQRALSTLAEIGEKDSADYATALNNLAGTHRLMGQFDVAEKEFESALGSYRNTVGERHVLYAAGLNNLSLVCLDRNDLSTAAHCQERAASILEALPQCRDEFASSLCNLSALYYRQGLLDQAEEGFRRAVGLFETELGTATPHYHVALNNLGAVYLKQKRYEKAADAFRSAVEAIKKLYGEEHPEYRAAQSHLQLAEMCRENGL